MFDYTDRIWNPPDNVQSIDEASMEAHMHVHNLLANHQSRLFPSGFHPNNRIQEKGRRLAALTNKIHDKYRKISDRNLFDPRAHNGDKAIDRLIKRNNLQGHVRSYYAHDPNEWSNAIADKKWEHKTKAANRLLNYYDKKGY